MRAENEYMTCVYKKHMINNSGQRGLTFRALKFETRLVRQLAAEVAGQTAACTALDSSSVYLLRFLRSCI